VTPLEHAFNALVPLLCQEIANRDKRIAELEDRPTRQDLAAAEQRALVLGDEVNVLRRDLHETRRRLALRQRVK
jgi:hypothetical protein